MAVIHVDGKSLEVDGSDNLLQALLSLGYDLPYFCYHPALGSVGSCRQCAVKQFNNEEDVKSGRGRLVMSCMVAPSDQMYISIDDAEAKAFRKHIVEYIMTNHPHDCPTCEEGGHCHLQDMTYMSGHRARRYRFTKRTHHNQDLGAFINHEMNRCIACYRCVRFYKDYAGGTDFGVYASNNRVYFGRDTEGQFESEFSGNLTEVCPTGVFTDKTHSDRYNRKWDMQYAPSICQGCSTGCNISAGERYGELRRIENRYNPDVNGYFLCDRGRFSYGFVNRGDRPITPTQNITGALKSLTADAALDGVAAFLKPYLVNKKVIGIGSASTSLESNFALKSLVGAENYSTGELLHTQNLTKTCIELLRHQAVDNLSLAQVETSDALFILGEDLTQTAPRVALSVRQAAKNEAKKMAENLKTPTWLAEPVKRIGQNHYSPIYIAGVINTKLNDVAKVSAVADIASIVDLGIKVADEILALPDDLTQILTISKDNLDNLAKKIACDLLLANRPLLISGSSLSSQMLLQATGYLAQNLTKKRQIIKEKLQQNILQENDAQNSKFQDVLKNYLSKTGIYLVMPEANSVGVSLLGGQALEEVLAKTFDVAIVVENELRDLSKPLQDKLFNQSIIVIDHQHCDWHDKAAFVLPAGTFAETDGTMVSAEGRMQRYFAAYDKAYYVPDSTVKDSWRWLFALSSTILNTQNQCQHLDDVAAQIAKLPDLSMILQTAPEADYRITGLKIARQPRRYSGRTSMRAKISVHEPMQPKDTDTALTFSMEGYVGDKTAASVTAFAWSAGWNSPQAWNKYQDKVGGRLKGGDVGVRVFDVMPRLEHDYVSFVVPQTPKSDLQTGQASLVPVYDIFASSNLSQASPVVAEVIKPAAWFIGQDEAQKWQLQDGDVLTISQHEHHISLPVKIVPYLAEDSIGYPVGLVPLVCYLPACVKKGGDKIYTPIYKKQLVNATSKPVSSLATFNTNLVNQSATKTNNNLIQERI